MKELTARQSIIIMLITIIATKFFVLPILLAEGLKQNIVIIMPLFVIMEILVIYVILRTAVKNENLSFYELLEKTFGDKFFNWRRYVSTNALYDWGFTPTEEDESAMSVGSIPPTLLTDGVHLKASGYMILGYKMWERMTQLGYFD